MEYNIRLNIKAICLTEHITGKPYLDFDYSNEDEYLTLIYAMVAVNNDVSMSLDDFKRLIKSSKIKKRILSDAEKCLSTSIQTPVNKLTETDNTETVNVYMSEIAGMLISSGVDVRYVMYDMDLWEMKALFNAIEIKKREDLENSRFWTFWNVAPHTGIKSPRDIILFEWERDAAKLEAESAIDRDLERFNKFIGNEQN